MKKILKIVGLVLLVIILVGAIFILTYQPQQYDEDNVFSDRAGNDQTL